MRVTKRKEERQKYVCEFRLHVHYDSSVRGCIQIIMGMSGNNSPVCVCVAGLCIWFHLFEVAVVRSWGEHDIIKLAASQQVCDWFLAFVHTCTCMPL